MRLRDKMEKIDEIEYNGFKTEFYITESVKIYLEKENIALDKLTQRDDGDKDDYSFFYEVLLFDLLDEDDDGIPDEKFGKNFKAIYYYAKKRKNRDNIGLEHEVIDESKEELNIKNEIGEMTEEILINKYFSFEIDYKIIKSSKK